MERWVRAKERKLDRLEKRTLEGVHEIWKPAFEEAERCGKGVARLRMEARDDLNGREIAEGLVVDQRVM